MKTREQENVAILKDFYEALADGNQGYAHELLDPNIEWVEHAEELFFAGRHVGRQVVFDEVIEPTHDKIKEFRFRPRKFFAVGDRVVVLGYETGTGRITELALKA